MNAVNHTEARAVHSAANVLQAADPSKHMILVPLSRLVLRPSGRMGRNVRKTAPRMSIPELAASIQRVGLLQNLIVIASADGEHYEVVAGGRRQQTRPVHGIDSDIRLNRALWLLADGMRALKA